MTDRTSEPRPAPGSEAGFSLLETLIASVLLLMVVIGVLPLFSRSMLNNAQGNDASKQVNATRDIADELLELPFNNQQLLLGVGDADLVTTEFLLLEGDRWVPDMTPFPNDEAHFTRTTTIEQFNAADLLDDDIEVGGTLDTPLVGGTSDNQIQIKRIRTEILSDRRLDARPYRVTTIKTYD
jgi:hypothetical protein